MSRIFDDDLKFGTGTRAVHAGQRPDPTSGAIMTPIYQTSTYAQEALGRNKGYEYARGKNPTREALERNIASLEGGTHGFAFASGMGTVDSIMKLFKSGDRILCADNMYGGTPRLFDRILVNMGLQFTYVDTRDPQMVEDAMTPDVKAIIVETFASLTAEEVVARLDAAQIGNARMNDMHDLWEHGQLAARHRIVDVDSPAGPIKALLPPGTPDSFEPRMDAIPSIGQHTDAILAEIGYDASAIASLREQHAIRGNPPCLPSPAPISSSPATARNGSNVPAMRTPMP